MQIYYPDEEEAGQGQWWNGSVAADMLDPEEAAAASADPWAAEGLWERYVVHWAEPPVRNSPPHHHITPRMALIYMYSWAAEAPGGNLWRTGRSPGCGPLQKSSSQHTFACTTFQVSLLKCRGL